MTGQSITVSGTIAAPRERVWHVITDIANAPTTIPSITAVTLLNDQPYGPGSSWRETRTMLGRTETHEMTVTESDPPRRTVVTAVTDGVLYTTTMTLEDGDEGEGTLLSITFGADQADASRAARFLWTVMGPLGKVFTRKMLTVELDEIREAATRSQ